ncbi:MAG: GTP-binding protein [Candidatus Weimeria sp.]
MITIDLITGFLGAGKTTFLRKYVKFLMAQGENVCILENDYGAVNVDMMLLSDLIGGNCDIEMVAGGCDSDCHRRRFKSKLIEMGMIGYTHVIVEPSGVFDVDEFYDSLQEDPLNRWYKAGTQVTIVDAGLRIPLSETSQYVFASEAANAGLILFSKTQLNPPEAPSKILKYLNSSLEKINCGRRFSEQEVLAENWDDLKDDDFNAIRNAGYKNYAFEKQQVMDEHKYESLYFMEKHFSADEIRIKAADAIRDPDCGGVIRIKGFFRDEKDGWMEINVTKDDFRIAPVEAGQDIVIVIGEHLGKERLSRYFGEPAEIQRGLTGSNYLLGP